MKTVGLLVVLSAFSAFAAEDAPVSLTASDGTGLKLLKLQARGVVQDPLAFTELVMTFENPLDRVLEGQFRVTLPQGASVSRFAMKIDGRWQEGEVVEKQAARRAYEDFLHRRQDPALLEQSGGNEFQARVFPIPARGTKEVVLSYSHELVQANGSYVLALKGLPEVGELDVKVSGVQGDGVLSKKKFVPNADFSAPVKVNQAGVRSGDLAVMRVVPVAGSEQDPISSVLLLVDSSGSRALGWSDQLKLVAGLAEALGKAGAQVSVAAFDQDVVEISGRGFDAAAQKKLKDRQALGASNVEAALKYAAATKAARVVLVTDGVLTAGVTEGPNLQAAVLKLKAAGVKRLDAVAIGGIRDEAALARLTTGSLEGDGAVIDGSLGASEVARRLALKTRSKLDVKVKGATAQWPDRLAGVQAGDSVLLYAQLPSGAPLEVSVGGKALAVAAGQMASIERPLLERAWARARITQLEEQLDKADGAPQRAKVKEQIVELSTRNRVLSSQTALLVLETEADYARFKIDRRALADILTVENGQVKALKRGPETVVAVVNKPPLAPRPAEAEKKKAKRDDDEGKMGKKDSADGAPGAPASKGAKMEMELAEEAEPPKPAAARPAPATRAPAPAPAAEPAPRAMESTADAPPPPPSPSMARERRVSGGSVGRGGDQPWDKGSDPYTGKFKDVMVAVQKKDKAKALSIAAAWHEEMPGDLLALVALGEALEANGELAKAARAYGSIIDLFSGRADLRRFAGVRMERLTAALDVAVDTFAKAAEQRPDHPASHRLLAFALLRAGKFEAAFEAIAKGVKQNYPDGRFRGVEQILREDAGLIAAAWMKAEPARKGEIEGKLKAIGGTVENAPSLRFVLNWETDANDVDFHISDGQGGHAYYSSMQLPSGGNLYADVTTGYGPECFTIRLPRNKRAYPYKLQAHYYSIGPMGAGMGKVELIEHDGNGGLKFEERPYVVMVNQAYVDLGVVNP